MVTRSILFAAFLSFSVSTIVAQAPKSEAKGTLRGIVVRADTNEPIGEVRISIGKGNSNAQLLLSAAQDEQIKSVQNSEAVSQFLRQAAESLAGTDTGRDFNTTTDKNGRFAFEGIPAGEYPISAVRDGFVALENSKTAAARATATVAPQQTIEIILKLVPGAGFSGRIVDSNSNAVTNATVEIFRRSDNDETSTPMQVSQRLSDDRGEYRFFQLPPGEYLLAVTPKASRVRTPSSRTFYPGTNDVSAATPVRLKPGDNLTGVNIEIQNLLEVIRPVPGRP